MKLDKNFLIGAVVGAAAVYFLTSMGRNQQEAPIKVPPIQKPLPSTIPSKSPVILRGLVA